MQNSLHSHRFMGRTTFNDGHIHEYSGITSVNLNSPGHIHYMAGETTFEDGHIHRYSLQTGPSIPLAVDIYTITTLQPLLRMVIFTIYGYTSVYNNQ